MVIGYSCEYFSVKFKTCIIILFVISDCYLEELWSYCLVMDLVLIYIYDTITQLKGL
jgi:hypothetical protein